MKKEYVYYSPELDDILVRDEKNKSKDGAWLWRLDPAYDSEFINFRVVSYKYYYIGEL